MSVTVVKPFEQSIVVAEFAFALIVRLAAITEKSVLLP